MNSLERRLTTGMVVTLLLVFGLLLWGAVAAVKSLGEAYLMTRLEHDTEALLVAVGPGPRGQFRLRHTYPGTFRIGVKQGFVDFDAAGDISALGTTLTETGLGIGREGPTLGGAFTERGQSRGVLPLAQLVVAG